MGAFFLPLLPHLSLAHLISPLSGHAIQHLLTPAPPLQAQRNNEDISVIPPLFTVSVDHRVSGLVLEAENTGHASMFLG